MGVVTGLHSFRITIRSVSAAATSYVHFFHYPFILQGMVSSAPSGWAIPTYDSPDTPWPRCESPACPDACTCFKAILSRDSELHFLP